MRTRRKRGERRDRQRREEKRRGRECGKKAKRAKDKRKTRGAEKERRERGGKRTRETGEAARENTTERGERELFFFSSVSSSCLLRSLFSFPLLLSFCLSFLCVLFVPCLFFSLPLFSPLSSLSCLSLLLLFARVFLSSPPSLLCSLLSPSFLPFFFLFALLPSCFVRLLSFLVFSCLPFCRLFSSCVLSLSLVSSLFCLFSPLFCLSLSALCFFSSSLLFFCSVPSCSPSLSSLPGCTKKRRRGTYLNISSLIYIQPPQKQTHNGSNNKSNLNINGSNNNQISTSGK